VGWNTLAQDDAGPARTGVKADPLAVIVRTDAAERRAPVGVLDPLPRKPLMDEQVRIDVP
jgi:hypothetical protein